MTYTLDETQETLNVTLAHTDRLREMAHALITDVTTAHHGSKPPTPTTGEILVGMIGDEVVSTTSFDLSEGMLPFPLESIWEFNTDKTPLPFNRQKVMQMSRWFKQPGRKNVAEAPFYECILQGLKAGREYAFFETRDHILKHLNTMGIISHKISDAQILFDLIPIDEQGYHCSVPPPYLYMAELKQMLYAVQEYIETTTMIQREHPLQA